MSLYKEFSGLLPYIQSVRKLKNYLSFDVSFPEQWKLPKKYVKEDKVIEQESKTQGFRLLSFVTEIDEEGVEDVTNSIHNIIEYNLEREEKERLFELKVNELKKIFEKQELTNLKKLSFEVTPDKIEFEDGEETITTN
jgi:hypothetical protein